MTTASPPADSPMRILHVASHAGLYRGGAVQLVRMAAAQAELGHAVTAVVNVSAKAERIDRIRDANSWAPARNQGIEIATLAYEGRFGRWRLRRLMKRRRYDVFHCHRLAALQACVSLAREIRPSPPIVFQRGTISPLSPEEAALVRSGAVGAVIAVSQAVRDQLVKGDGVSAEKVHVVYGSVNTEDFAPRPPSKKVLAEFGVSEDAFVIGSISAWRKAKGFETIIAALKDLFAAEPRAWFLCIGHGTEENVRSMAAEHGIEARCVFLDHQTDIPLWLTAVDVSIVAASGREGLSGVLRESLAMERPVITTDCAGNPELVRDGETGLVIPPNDAAALAAALSRAMHEPEAMKRMATAGRQWVLEHCSPAGQAAKLLAVYGSLSAGGGRVPPDKP